MSPPWECGARVPTIQESHSVFSKSRAGTSGHLGAWEWGRAMQLKIPEHVTFAATLSWEGTVFTGPLLVPATFLSAANGMGGLCPLGPPCHPARPHLPRRCYLSSSRLYEWPVSSPPSGTPAAPPAGSSCPPLPACSFWHTALSKSPVEQGGTQGHQAARSRPSTGSHADAWCVTFCIGTCLKQGVALGDHVCQTGCAPACLDHGQVSLVWPGRPSHLFPGRRALHTPDSGARWAPQVPDLHPHLLPSGLLHQWPHLGNAHPS